jgi:hypothetical protein
VILFRSADPRLPLLAETADQPPARWHAAGEGPVQYLFGTPDGAWAELVRHEEITTPEDLATIRRALWAVEVPALPPARPALPGATLTGGAETYPACREEARRLRDAGEPGLVAPSAALRRAPAGLVRAADAPRDDACREDAVIVLFGGHARLAAWTTAVDARPADDLLARVRRAGPATSP